MANSNPSLDFKFQPELKSNLNLELPFTEHVEELRQRSFHVLAILILVSFIAFIDILTSPVLRLTFTTIASMGSPSFKILLASSTFSRLISEDLK